MRYKIKLLLVRRDGVGNEAIAAGLLAEAARLQGMVSERVGICIATGDADPELHAVAAGAFEMADRPFDATLDLATTNVVPGEARAGWLGGLAERLEGLVEADRSRVMVGTEHVILPGSGPVLVVIANRRLPRFTHAGFLEYWLDYHGPFARTHTPPEIGFRYRQFHADAEETGRASSEAGFGAADFDGAAECFYPDEAALRRLMAMTAVVDQATVDEKGFVDHARCVTSVLAVRYQED